MKLIYLLLFALLFYYVLANTKAIGQELPECPPGSYTIGIKDGKKICKNQPTGCAFGDSIPVESPKCSIDTTIIKSTMSQNTITDNIPGK